jgi:hypothetical protein
VASEVAPYVCPYCGASFTKRATLNAHIHRLHREAREREAEEMKAAEVKVKKKEEKATPVRVSEASAEEFERFEPSAGRRRVEETASERVCRMLLEGKVVKVEGNRGQLIALLANIGRLLYRYYRVDLKTAAEYKLDMKQGVLYIKLKKLPPR